MGFSVIGKSAPKIDSMVKATGEAKYAVDLKLSGMLYGKILRSPLPHARILNIDTSKAVRLPGVKAVITGKDTLGIKYGQIRKFPKLQDQLGLAIDKVRHIGDEVAAVAAIDEDTAQEALALIKVDYEPLPAVFGPEEAMKEGAPRIHDHVERNISFAHRLEFGDVEKGFKESDHIREDRFFTQPQAHASLEPHACVASFDPSGRLTVWSSTQSTYYKQCDLAKTLGMREGDVRVIRPYVGGAFGGKVSMHSVDFCSALLSKKSGRPVKIEYTRAEEFAAARVRHPMEITLRTGVKKDGTVVAREARIIIDGGAYNDIGPVVAINTCNGYAYVYRTPNYRALATRVYTNKQPSGAVRGFGHVQAQFAIESQLDMIAEDLGIDPVELRLKNARQTGDVIMATKLHSCGLSECLRKVAQGSGWQEKRGKLPRGRGIGLGCYAYISGTTVNQFNVNLPFSEAWVRVNEDGTAYLLTQAVDIGQGSDTVLSMIVAEELGIALEDVKIVTPDTDTCPVDFGTFSSRVTMMAGNAAKAAAADARRHLLEAAANRLELAIQDELEAKDGRIYIKTAPEKGISIAEAALAAQRTRSGMPVIGRGIFDVKGKGVPTPTVSFGAQAIEVEVDEETGQVKVLKVTAVDDCGRALNPVAVEGQLEGSVHMGLGYALNEDVLFEEGRVLNPSFLDYKILSAVDMPEIESSVVETNDPIGPFGAKEVSEGLIVPTCPAIVSAVCDAIGVRIKSLPITPEKILKALKEKG